MLTDHQPANHQETERSEISEIIESVIVNAIKPKEQCAQSIISVSEDQRAQTNISISNTDVIEVEIHSEEIGARDRNTDVIEVEIHSEEIGAQHVVHFGDAQVRSDAGSLITQAPQSNSLHATINALSTWISAVQPCESWYLAGWIKDSPIDFLVDPGAVVSAILLIGMTMGQLDDYAFLVARLSHRYDPPEREEAHRAELCARTRRQNESADEFTENLKNLAQRAYTHADQNMLDNLVVERFREGHSNEELKKHLCLCPSTGLQDLIGACVRFETHVEIGTRANKSNEGLYTVQGSNCQS